MNPHNDIYYQQHQFHDSGIADEVGLSDEDDSPTQENPSEENDTPKKPSQSYLEIIAEAILKTPSRTMQLFEIYTYFQRKYRYFAEDINKSWKNSVRHNLSLNDCFVKAGRGANGKGHFWRIHELAERDFEQGRFRRRRYRQQMRQLQMQPSPYEPQPVSSYYPPTSYYMCSPPPSYHTIYQTPNSSSENHPITPPDSSSTMQTYCSTPIAYPLYDPYSTLYYPTSYHSMALSYSSPNDSAHFDA